MTIKNEEPEITVETPPPVPVEPPVEVHPTAPLVETDALAVPVDEDNQSPLSSSTSSNPTTCTIIAPATLGPFYSFTANVDGIDFLVTVPEGGVTEGQAFQVPYPTTSNANPATAVIVTNTQQPQNPTNIPTGHWRNDICDCCEVISIGMFWQGWCCTPILLGQLMTRFKLNLCGTPSASYERTFWVVLGLWILCLFDIWVFWEHVYYLVIILWPIFMCILIMNTRYQMRKKYNIPVNGGWDGCDGKCQDCCCGLFCAFCATIQMARHTHSHRDYPYNCCSTTGLYSDAPEVV
jgi:Cys-rich protein (TIGR01571 family)